jgi:hypothetical protein
MDVKSRVNVLPFALTNVAVVPERVADEVEVLLSLAAFLIVRSLDASPARVTVCRFDG